MAITKIQSNAFPTTIDLSNVDLTLGAGEVLTANIADSAVHTTKVADLAVTHAKLHTDMDLTSKTVVLPTLSSLGVSGNISTGTLTASSYIAVGSLVVNDPGSNYYSYNNRIGGPLALVGNLDVDGVVSISVNSTSHDTFRFTTEGVNEAKLIMKDANSVDDIVLNTAGSSWFNGGNVGIGTNAPFNSAKLHIVRDVNAGAGSGAGVATGTGLISIVPKTFMLRFCHSSYAST